MRLLIVAYYYPPPDSGGSERPRQMAKYLPRCGHPTTVLTHGYGPDDFCQPAAIRIGDISRNQDRRGFRFWQWLSLRLAAEACNRLGRYRTIYTSWKKRVCSQAEAIARHVQPDLLIASYPPVEDLEIGLYLSRHFGLPLVCDFRDGLLFEPIESRMLDRFASFRRRYVQVEAESVAGSAAILSFSPLLTAYFRSRYGHPRVETLPNGFDEEEYGVASPAALAPTPGVLNLVHTGSIGLSQPTANFEPFCRALEKIVASPGGDRIRLHFLGRLSSAEKYRLHTLVRGGHAQLYGQRPRPEVLSFQRSGDLLFFITPKRQSAAPAKLFEYLGANRPILALAPDSSYAAQIVRETGSGWSVDPEDAPGIQRLLEQLLADPALLTSLHPDQARIAEFSRQRQMTLLSEVLVDLAGSKA